MSRTSRPLIHELTPLPVGTPLHGGAWTIAEIKREGGRHLLYMGTGRSSRKVAIQEYFPPNWLREDDSPAPLEEITRERDLRRFFYEALDLIRGVPPHPGIVSIHDLFEENGTHYAVYEWHDGWTLFEVMRRWGPLPIPTALSILSYVGEALAHLHGHGLLHRDVNPFSIHIDPKGVARLTDFETVSPYPRTRNFPDVSIVNPSFAPIELLSVFPSYGPESDVYALAALGYWMMTGRRAKPSAARAASPRLESAHRLRASIPETVSTALDHALAVRAKERTPTIEAFLEELTR